ncbi:hypothetical protein PHLCEN_2v6074 [Hermanssonia centrifuga]|uniref:Uncharacterized protein n=1 Tax=Hermanssonia centrifuga TaxID=98765 RepID=A0A2R6P0I2_9APHY|nr:hypothetical protein PHLCEN_2v6074 [Hermanssonia centrifuga]
MLPGHIVESKLKAQEDQEDDLAVRFLQDAYLSVLYSFQGPKYKRLSFDVHGRSSSPTPYWGESSGELVIRYGNVTDAANAALGIPLLAKTGQLIYIANVHDENDEWVRVRLALINPSGDVAQDRQTIVNPLAAALFGGKLFFEHPPLFPNAQDRVLGLVKWGK